jgi:hypothetical protein
MEGVMSCTRHFLNFHWEQHRWRSRVSSAEIMTAEEPDMWGRTVFRDYVRCDKADVCQDCGAVRHPVSCVCDMARGEACRLRQEFLARPDQPAK